MSQGDLPEGTADDAALSFDEGVDDITNLLADSDVNPGDEDQDQQEQAEAEGDEPEAEANAEDADPVEAEESDGSEEAAGGRFVSKDAKVRLEDGTVITVGDLARNNLYQRDYTRKTSELAEERRQLEGYKQKFGEHAQALKAQRDFLLSVAPKLLPQPPDRSMMETDPMGYMQAKADYDERMTVISQLTQAQQAELQRANEEQAQSFNEMRRQEAERLFSAAPELKNPQTYQQFWSDAVTTMAERYGFSEQEINEATDHRFYLAMRDLVKFHKAMARAPKVKEQIQQKPKLISGGKRMDPKVKISREAGERAQRLRQTGSFEAGVAALMDLDL